MKKIKVLNLYACLGGNRLKWDNNLIDVTAVELDPVAAELYQERFPQDKVVVGDAHEYLLFNFQKFDFIWSSPPCPTHSKARFARWETTTPAYADMKLYEEIILLENKFNGKYCIENVVPYYKPLRPAQKRGRHLYWTNFKLPAVLSERKSSFMEGKNEVQKWCKFHEYDFYQYTKRGGKQRLDKMARNLVDFEAGKTIFETAYNIMKDNTDRQISMF